MGNMFGSKETPKQVTGDPTATSKLSTSTVVPETLINDIHAASNQKVQLNKCAKDRIHAQLKEIMENPPTNWKLYSSQQKPHKWSIWITAESRSPFHTLPFELIVYFPTNYPHEKADFKLKETHRFFHPNISRITGNICSKIVTSGQISLQIRDRVNAFIILLSEPNPEDGFNNEATAMYSRDKCEYFRTAFKMFRGLQP